jgi:hypothetical protein
VVKRISVGVVAGLLQRPPLAVGFGAAKPPREVFLVGFGGEAAKTNQKWRNRHHPNDPVQWSNSA